jgi:hypothetical protein
MGNPAWNGHIPPSRTPRGDAPGDVTEERQAREIVERAAAEPLVRPAEEQN